ncbi:MAG TPA: haloacid dehalogenase-like hydrolase [Micropepsaceae bacterium]|nr:haloacid dehalogenase-like hydrolase [Micropepsaceae bacterium]
MLKLLLLDVEGTVCLFGEPASTPELQSSLWHALAYELGPAAVARDIALYDAWYAGAIDSYAAWCRQAVDNLVASGLTKELFAAGVAQTRIAPGADALVEAARNRGIHLALISGGFSELVRHVQRRLDIPFGQGAVDILDWTSVPLKLALYPAYGAGKTHFARSLADDLHIDLADVGMVGDGRSDVHLAQSVGRSFAIHATDELRNIATDVVSSFDEIIGKL